MSKNNDHIPTLGKAFTEGVCNTIETMCGEKMSWSKPSLTENKTISADYIAVISMNGNLEQDSGIKEFKGSAILYWNMDHYLKTANSILGEEFEQYCEDIADVGLEISNISMGAAKTILNPKGYKIEMDTPKSIVNSEYTHQSFENSIIFKIPFKNSSIEFSMEISFSEE